jgi:hypothetical protein
MREKESLGLRIRPSMEISGVAPPFITLALLSVPPSLEGLKFKTLSCIIHLHNPIP